MPHEPPWQDAGGPAAGDVPRKDQWATAFKRHISHSQGSEGALQGTRRRKLKEGETLQGSAGAVLRQTSGFSALQAAASKASSFLELTLVTIPPLIERYLALIPNDAVLTARWSVRMACELWHFVETKRKRIRQGATKEELEADGLGEFHDRGDSAVGVDQQSLDPRALRAPDLDAVTLAAAKHPDFVKYYQVIIAKRYDGKEEMHIWTARDKAKKMIAYTERRNRSLFGTGTSGTATKEKD